MSDQQRLVFISVLSLPLIVVHPSACEIVKLDPAVYRRMQVRGDKVTEEIRKKYGTVEIAVDLIRETDSIIQLTSPFNLPTIEV